MMTNNPNETNIYLAGGWFTETQDGFLTEAKTELFDNQTAGNIYQPKMNQGTLKFGTPEWRYDTFNHDIKAINNSDIIVAIVTEDKIDTGTIWEIGYAVAINKPVVLLTDSRELNLMLSDSVSWVIPITENPETLVSRFIPLSDLRLDLIKTGLTNQWLGNVE